MFCLLVCFLRTIILRTSRHARTHAAPLWPAARRRVGSPPPPRTRTRTHCCRRSSSWFSAFQQRRDIPTSGEKRSLQVSKHANIPAKQRVPNYVGKRNGVIIADRPVPPTVRRPNKLQPNYVGKRHALDFMATANFPNFSHRLQKRSLPQTNVKTSQSSSTRVVGDVDVNDIDDSLLPQGSYDSDDLTRDSFVDHMSKRPRFIGKRSSDANDDEIDNEKRHNFVGKRNSNWTKRPRYVGKRSDDDSNNNNNNNNNAKRRLFVGKRSDTDSMSMMADESDEKRRLFVGKRPKFVGKRYDDAGSAAAAAPTQLGDAETVINKRPNCVGKRDPPLPDSHSIMNLKAAAL